MSAFWPHADSADWWDGPDRYKRINRAEVAMIQNETLLRTLSALVPGNKVDLGGPTFPLDGGGFPDFTICNLVARPGVDLVGDACKTGLPSRSFQVVFSSHTIEHVHDVDAFLSECDRLLAPGGLLYLICPDRRHFAHSDTGHPERSAQMPPGERTYEEFSPEELQARVRCRLPHLGVCSFNSRQNRYDFEIAARKPGA